jgi:hypothetical protein
MKMPIAEDAEGAEARRAEQKIYQSVRHVPKTEVPIGRIAFLNVTYGCK